MNHAALVSDLLQKMEPATRREFIRVHLSEARRRALESHLLRKRDIDAAPKDSDLKQSPLEFCSPLKADRCLVDGKLSQQGIFKTMCNGKTYNYFAKATIQCFVFYSQTWKELDRAVQDHIILLQITERIRRDVSCTDFPAKVRQAVTDVLRDVGQAPGQFMRAFHIIQPAQHWIGRALWVYRDNLEGALGAWQALHSGRESKLFSGGHCTAAYTPEKAAAEWLRLRRAYIALRVEGGRCAENDVEAHLQSLESTFAGRAEKMAKEWRLRQESAGKVDAQARCVSRLKTLLRAWDLADSTHSRSVKPRARCSKSHACQPQTKRARQF